MLTVCSRDDKRYTEKKNKSERARRKKEDTARLRQLVDLTLALDPRIKRIKQEEKEARESKKKSKTGGQNGLSDKQKEEEDKKKAEEEAKKKEEAENVRFFPEDSALCLLTHGLPCTGCARRRQEGQNRCCQRCQEGTTTGSRCWRRRCCIKIFTRHY